MKLSELFKVVEPSDFGYDYEYAFLRNLFSAAGITRKYSVPHLRSVFNGTKPFNNNMKKQFKKPVNEIAIADFFEKKIKNDSVDKLINSFGISHVYEKNKSCLCHALAHQIALFIHAKEENVEITLKETYIEQLKNKDKAHSKITDRLYPDDDVWVQNSNLSHNVAYYEKFEHTWVIHNWGKTIWDGRKLVFSNLDSVTPKAEQYEIEVPYLEPGKITELNVRYDARGKEGAFICKWNMLDSDGNDCFPNSINLFDVRINVEARFLDEEELPDGR